MTLVYNLFTNLQTAYNLIAGTNKPIFPGYQPSPSKVNYWSCTYERIAKILCCSIFYLHTMLDFAVLT